MGGVLLVLSCQYFQLVTAQFRVACEVHTGSHDIILMHQMLSKETVLYTNQYRLQDKTPSLWRLIDIKEKEELPQARN